jgi:protein KRI1
VVDYTIQPSGTHETENKKKQLLLPKNSDQSSNTQKSKKRKKKKRAKSEEGISCSTPVETQPVSVMSKKHNINKVSGKKFQKASRQSDVFKKQEDPGISDARLRAYGINPKKFKNKLKYGNNQAMHNGVRHSV